LNFYVGWARVVTVVFTYFICRNAPRLCLLLGIISGVILLRSSRAQERQSGVGREVAIPRHLENGEEFEISIPQLIAYGKELFRARWTSQEGAGRPATKGMPNGPGLSQTSKPLNFPFNFNRLSGPDANSCSGCHNIPQAGGGGDIVANVFVLGQRFDFMSFGSADGLPTQGVLDERGTPVTLQTFANQRKTIGMNGSGFIEMLARQITAELQAIRDGVKPGTSRNLFAKGISLELLRGL